VIDCAKYRFLDFISVACRGSIADPSQTIYRFVREMEKGEGVIVGTREKAPYLYSALANGTSSHAIEMDDVDNEASLHPGVVVFPSALATGEMVGASGKRFILAVVLGYEVMVRLGSALGPENSYKRGFHPTGTCGTFGSSVASSKILGLQEEEILNAIGISGSQAAGSMEYLAQGAWTKPFQAGWAAHSGMVAALLSRKGFKGPSSILEGRDGFLHAYSNGADPPKVFEGLGSRFQILRTSVKLHSCCRYMQPPIDAVLKIVNENSLRPEQVKKIKLGVLSAGAPLIAEPIESKYNPQSIVDAQFSMPFGATAALLFGKAGLKEFQLSTIQSRPVREMMRKVVIPAFTKRIRPGEIQRVELDKNCSDFSKLVEKTDQHRREILMTSELFEKGLQIRREVLGAEYVDASISQADDFSRPMQELVTEFCWGKLWGRPGLDRKTRSLLNLAMLTALNRPHEVKLHIRGALNNGCSKDDIMEVFLQTAIYCGVAAAVDSFRLAKEVFQEIESKQEG